MQYSAGHGLEHGERGGLDAARGARLPAPTRADPLEEAVAHRLRKQQDHLFTFLDYPAVEATNNLAERQLRPAVISRKLSAGNKTERGERTRASALPGAAKGEWGWRRRTWDGSIKRGVRSAECGKQMDGMDDMDDMDVMDVMDQDIFSEAGGGWGRPTRD